MKKVCFYITALPVGGAERVVVDLLKKFSADPGFEPFIITDLDDSPLAAQLPENVVKIHLPNKKSAGAPARLVNGFKRILFLRRIIRRHEIDYLISNLARGNLQALFCRLLFGIKKTRLILVEHCVLSIYLELFGSPKYRLMHLFARFLYPLADRLVCVSEDVKNDFVKRHGIPEKICAVIPNPVDLGNITAMKAEPLEGDISLFLEGKKVLICAGRFVREKNQALLLKALQKAVAADAGIVLLLLGEGELRRELEENARAAGLSPNVKFLGIRKNPYKYINAAEVLVLPSKSEGFGIVVIEALALGKQVVAARNPSVDDILDKGKYGFLCGHNPDDMAEKILEAIARPKPRDLLVSRAAAYSLDRVYGKYKSLLLSF